jgi:cob(I)alamin adenosyltransferase
MEDKMTKEEVSGLKDMQQKMYTSRVDLGDVQVAISRLEIKKKSLIVDIEKQSSELNSYQKVLHNKYGDKTVDLETGVLSE